MGDRGVGQSAAGEPGGGAGKLLDRQGALRARSCVWGLAGRMNDRDVPDTVTSMVEVDGPHPLQS